ncbi:hypothetical protein HJC23_005945 [Cyclotella cryptica]|uniref:Ileal sodium/bile acid cotransporter n=1 Tax=Cyclotella cryptica TaxID=29204 RepID=A0ABD3R2A0_9STRA|eukprot:CCRYP_000507-RA/>CCRYP_000507-RA protein AED:0.00 eAED:0.00 QI:441/-1/1/1/-1/1/1/85/551
MIDHYLSSNDGVLSAVAMSSSEDSIYHPPSSISTPQDSLLHYEADDPISSHWDPIPVTQTPRHLSSIMDATWFSILAQILSNALLFLLVFGMSATVEVQHLREQVHNKFAILTGLSTQFIVMPLLGYLSVLLLTGDGGLTEPMALSLLIVTASPGGSYSNWWCSMFNADLALSVTMTAIGTVVSSIMLPANLILYVNAAFGFGSRKGDNDGDGGSVLGNIDWPSLFISLAIVIVAIGSGLCASFKISSHRFNRFANRLGSLSGVLLVVFSALLSSLSNNKNSQIWGQPWSFYVGVSLPCIVGLFIATFFACIARLKRPEVVSVGVECCYQNVGIATSAAVSMFSDPVERGQALCVPLFYGVMEAVVLGLYCIIAWKCGWTKAPRDDKFCVMIMTTYEVEDDEIQSQLDEEDQRSISRHHSETSESDENHEQQPPQTDANFGTADKKKEIKSGWWSVFKRSRKRTKSQETALEIESVTQQPMESPIKRISVLAADLIKDGLDSITEDGGYASPGILVSFNNIEDKVEYCRCRLHSDDSAIASMTSANVLGTH